MLTDEQLVIKLIEGSKPAFGEIYDRYWYKLFCIAYHQIGTREEAEELVHDLFESLWNRRAESNIRHLSSYLVISMKHLITNFIKSKITWRKYKEYILLQKMQESSITEQDVEFTDLSTALDNALKKLPEKTSKIFQLSQLRSNEVNASSTPIKKIKTSNKYQLLNAISTFNKFTMVPSRMPIPRAKKALAIFFKAFIKR